MLTKIKSALVRFANDESGASLFEYSLLLAIITGGAVTLVLGGGNWIVGQWNELAADLTNTTAETAPGTFPGQTGG